MGSESHIIQVLDMPGGTIQGSVAVAIVGIEDNLKSVISNQHERPCNFILYVRITVEFN